MTSKRKRGKREDERGICGKEEKIKKRKKK